MLIEESARERRSKLSAMSIKHREQRISLPQVAYFSLHDNLFLLAQRDQSLGLEE